MGKPSLPSNNTMGRMLIIYISFVAGSNDPVPPPDEVYNRGNTNKKLSPDDSCKFCGAQDSFHCNSPRIRQLAKVSYIKPFTVEPAHCSNDQYTCLILVEKCEWYAPRFSRVADHRISEFPKTTGCIKSCSCSVYKISFRSKLGLWRKRPIATYASRNICGVL